jgi:hypothetical protein
MMFRFQELQSIKSIFGVLISPTDLKSSNVSQLKDQLILQKLSLDVVHVISS